jgi:hypothetical protein
MAQKTPSRSTPSRKAASTPTSAKAAKTVRKTAAPAPVPDNVPAKPQAPATPRTTAKPQAQAPAVPNLDKLGAGPDFASARTAWAETLNASHRLLDWMLDVQQIQTRALREWNQAVSTAAASAGSARAWTDLLAVQNELVSDGLSRLANQPAVWASALMDLQSIPMGWVPWVPTNMGLLSNQMTSFKKEADSAGKQAGAAATPEDKRSAAAAERQPQLIPAAFIEQAQAGWNALMQPWAGSLLTSSLRH